MLLYIHTDPPKFKLAPPLARLLGIAVESRVKILQAIWEYIKANKLQVHTFVDVLRDRDRD